jgi:hypothetical protein
VQGGRDLISDTSGNDFLAIMNVDFTMGWVECRGGSIVFGFDDKPGYEVTIANWTQDPSAQIERIDFHHDDFDVGHTVTNADLNFLLLGQPAHIWLRLLEPVSLSGYNTVS